VRLGRSEVSECVGGQREGDGHQRLDGDQGDLVRDGPAGQFGEIIDRTARDSRLFENQPEQPLAPLVVRLG